MGEPKLNDSDPGVGGNGGIGDDRGVSAGGGATDGGEVDFVEPVCRQLMNGRGDGGAGECCRGYVSMRSGGGGPGDGAGGLISRMAEVEVGASVPASVDVSARNNGSSLTSAGELPASSCPWTWRGVDSSNGFLNCTARAGRDAVSSLSVKGEPSDVRVEAEGPACGVDGCGGEGNRLGPAVALLGRRRFGRGTGRW